MTEIKNRREQVYAAVDVLRAASSPHYDDGDQIQQESLERITNLLTSREIKDLIQFIGFNHPHKFMNCVDMVLIE